MTGAVILTTEHIKNVVPRNTELYKNPKINVRDQSCRPMLDRLKNTNYQKSVKEEGYLLTLSEVRNANEKKEKKHILILPI